MVKIPSQTSYLAPGPRPHEEDGGDGGVRRRHRRPGRAGGGRGRRPTSSSTPTAGRRTRRSSCASRTAGRTSAWSSIDTGQMVDPRAVPRVDLGKFVTERRTGGLGMHLMEKIMDSVTFRRSARRNVCAPGEAQGAGGDAVTGKPARAHAGGLPVPARAGRVPPRRRGAPAPEADVGAHLAARPHDHPDSGLARTEILEAALLDRDGGDAGRARLPARARRRPAASRSRRRAGSPASPPRFDGGWSGGEIVFRGDGLFDAELAACGPGDRVPRPRRARRRGRDGRAPRPVRPRRRARTARPYGPDEAGFLRSVAACAAAPIENGLIHDELGR